LVERPVSFLTCYLPAGPRSPCFDFKAYRPQSVPTSFFVAGSVGAGDGDGGSEGGGRVRAGGRARGSAEDGAVPLTGRRHRCQARRGWCRARCGGGLRGMPLLRIQGRLPRRVPPSASPAEQHNTQTLLLAAFLWFVCLYMPLRGMRTGTVRVWWVCGTRFLSAQARIVRCNQTQSKIQTRE
jgi:hypothetical protein